MKWLSLEGVDVAYRHRAESVEFVFLKKGKWIFLHEYFHEMGYIVPPVFTINGFKDFIYNGLKYASKVFRPEAIFSYDLDKDKSWVRIEKINLTLKLYSIIFNSIKIKKLFRRNT